MEKHKAGSPNIHFHFLFPVRLPNRKLLKHFISYLFEKQQIKFESLQIVFCSDEYLLRLNQKFLAHNTYTDIITFNLATPGDPIIAELYISIERVRENAAGLSLDPRDELLRVIFHGLLHLLDWTDKTPSQKRAMRSEEDRLLRAFNSYVSRET